MTDWIAQHSGLASVQNGLDIAMPDILFWSDGKLDAMVTNGSLAQSRLDDMAIRIWRLIFGSRNSNQGPACLPISMHRTRLLTYAILSVKT